MKPNGSTSKLTYLKCIVDGVEIKRCRQTYQSYKPHVHNELSIGYIEEGSTHVEFGGDTLSFVKGDGIVIPPLTSHCCSPTDIRQWQFVMLYIEPRYYEGSVRFDQVMKLSGDSLRQVTAFVHLLETEEDKGTLESRLIELLVELGEPIAGETHPGEEDHQAERVMEIRNWLVDRYQENWTLETLENTFGLSRFAIIRQFKRRFHTTPRAFQLQVKVAASKKLLAEGVEPFEIMERVGFYDQAHFIREFKKMSGVTPKGYLQSL
ncbi:helix-turn-helix domain-containing protein [Gorillibacterium sp. sgz5001074]|uniref:helix-turn-helix domain-containing protein n=1 Tax=Gorillibacterium sp. sgz5001074 TaxID=3446695 RepID=UPI003F668BCC